jgi:subtilase family serine protease
MLFSVGYYLSSDSVISTNDLLIGQRGLGVVAPGVSDSATTVLAISPGVPPGNYYLGAIADFTGSRGEANETNNAILGGPITISSGPELEASSVKGPSVSGTSLSILITNAVRNTGTGNSGPFAVGIYLSSTSNSTSNAVKLASRSISNLGPAMTDTASTPVHLSTSLVPGPYYVIVTADDADVVAEMNEANNAASTPILILTGPDLVVTAVSGPESVSLGGSILVTNCVENRSMLAVTSPFRVGLYLSVDTRITTNDLRIGTRTITTGLAGGESSTAVTMVNLPVLSTGRYRLGAIVDYDDEAVEADES